PDRARLERLARGVNLSHWYSQHKGEYDEDHLSSYITPEDAALIRSLGFTHVRLPVDPEVLFARGDPPVLRPAALDGLVERIGWLVAADLGVVVDLHPKEGFKKALADPEGVKALVTIWEVLAKRLGEATDPDWVFLEAVNEPEPLRGAEWQEVQGAALEAMRRGAPKHTLIAAGGSWSGADQLVLLEPYSDGNVVYTFHWYDPFIFTHQGATWGWEVMRDVAQVGWPIAPGEEGIWAERSGATPEAQGAIRGFIESGEMTEAAARKRLEKVDAWARDHGGLPIYVGEFGVFRKVSPEADRLRWLAFSRTEFEKRGWGWALWDYSGGFAVAPRLEGVRRADRAMVQALGLVAEEAEIQMP
ncbi:MAG: cellulase family glycosylhydrolase, partial [Verrucomicrobiia bacterium]